MKEKDKTVWCFVVLRIIYHKIYCLHCLDTTRNIKRNLIADWRDKITDLISQSMSLGNLILENEKLKKLKKNFHKTFYSCFFKTQSSNNDRKAGIVPRNIILYIFSIKFFMNSYFKIISYRLFFCHTVLIYYVNLWQWLVWSFYK